KPQRARILHALDMRAKDYVAMKYIAMHKHPPAGLSHSDSAASKSFAMEEIMRSGLIDEYVRAAKESPEAARQVDEKILKKLADAGFKGEDLHKAKAAIDDEVTSRMEQPKRFGLPAQIRAT